VFSSKRITYMALENGASRGEPSELRCCSTSDHNFEFKPAVSIVKVVSSGILVALGYIEGNLKS
jgi:hypothetical protein